MNLWFALWLATIGIVVVIPVMAWQGRPRAFARVHWFCVTVGAGYFAFYLLFRCLVALLSLRPEWVTLSYLWGAIVLIAIGIGSLLAVFFCRPGRK